MNNYQIETGTLLLAEPFMEDFNFKRSAVLICDHHGEGDLGFIINKPLNMGINDLISDFPKFESNVFYGGPVHTDSIHYIHTTGEILDDSQPIGSGLYWGGDFKKLKFLIQSELIQPKDIKFFIGYSGWSENQLHEEIETGSWIITEMNSNYLFKFSHHKLWKKILHTIGNNYSIIAEIPENLSWN